MLLIEFVKANKLEESSITMILDKAVWLDEYHPIPVVQNSGAMIVGRPGTGKSIAASLLALQLIKKYGAQLLIADTKRSDLYGLKDVLIDGDKRVAATPAQVAKLLRTTSNNLSLRYEHHHDCWGWTWLEYHLRPIVILFDEVGSTLSEADRKTREEIMSYLKQIIYRSRQMGIYVILASQRLSASTMDRDLSLELSTRIVMGSSDGDTLRMAFPGVDVKELPPVKRVPGHGLIYTDLLGTAVPQSIVVDDPSRLNIPELVKYLDIKASRMDFAKELYWQ